MCLPANSCALLSPHCLWPGGVPLRGAAGQAAVPERSPCSITGAARRTPRGAFNSNAQRACAKGGAKGGMRTEDMASGSVMRAGSPAPAAAGIEHRSQQPRRALELERHSSVCSAADCWSPLYAYSKREAWIPWFKLRLFSGPASYPALQLGAWCPAGSKAGAMAAAMAAGWRTMCAATLRAARDAEELLRYRRLQGEA